jgi:adenosylcobinamide amidohydrolase
VATGQALDQAPQILVGLMKAVSLSDLVTVRESCDQLWVEGFVTAGTSSLHARVKRWTGRPGATGTGTDVVVVVGGNGPSLRYSGTYTVIGELVGRVIWTAVPEGLTR